jgi:adenylate cyclase, class 2
MANEIEAKARVERLDQVRGRLGRLGARLVESGFEHNIVFDTPDGRLRSKDSLLRLRKYVTSVLTFKGPRAGSRPVKSRREVEFEVSDFDSAAELLESLGFVRTWTYQKQREKWSLDEAKVFLDVVPYLGSFVEVEAADEERVMEALGRLGIPKSSITPATYLELFEEYRRTSGETTTDMVFREGKQ